MIMAEKHCVLWDLKTFSFNFDWLKVVGKNLKREIEFNKKNNKSLTENKIKNKIEQFLKKYKHGNNIYELGK